jgi:uncharacterized protein (DUF427 family)
VAVATWNGAVLAESDDVEIVDGYPYFPRASLRLEHFEPSDTTSRCHWKGMASYYSLRVNGEVNRDAAWYYPEPKPAAAVVSGRVGFWRGVVITGLRNER